MISKTSVEVRKISNFSRVFSFFLISIPLWSDIWCIYCVKIHYEKLHAVAPKIKESDFEAFVEKIVVSKDGFDWYLRFDGDPNDPLHLKTVGKRRNKTEIIDPKAETLDSASHTIGSY